MELRLRGVRKAKGITGLNFLDVFSITERTNTDSADIVVGAGAVANVYAFSRDGVTVDQAAMQAALDSGLPLVVPPGDYTINGDLVVPTHTRIYAPGHGTVRFLNCHLRIEGSNGAEVNITGAVAKGATVLAVSSTTGRAAGDWIRLVSCINANSHDAGVDQLGGRTADFSFLSEFARIKSVDSPTQLTLEAGTLWPYPIAAGADSSSRTTSTFMPVTFNERVRIVGIDFVGRSGANNEIVSGSLARDARLIGCEVDTNGAACIAARLSYCLDSHLVGGRYVGNPAATTAAENDVILRSCTDCTLREGARLEYGFQGIDVTYGVNDTALWGGPSISCGADTVSARGQVSDAFTDHPGVYDTLFHRVKVTGAIRAIRLRGRASKAKRCTVAGHTVNGVLGIFVEGGFTAGWAIEGCTVQGFANGIEFTPDEGSSSSRPTTDGTASGRIVGNDLDGCVNGIVGVTPSTVNALVHDVKIDGNRLRNISGNPIYVSSYCNGVDVGKNSIFGVVATKGGVTFEANVKRLRVDRNTILGVDAAGFAVKGPSTATFITDLTTFPAGNAEAHLFLSDQVTDAATAFSGIIRDATAFDTPKAAGWTGFCVPISTVIPADAAVERNSVVFYLDGTPNIQAKFKDATGTVFTKAVT